MFYDRDDPERIATSNAFNDVPVWVAILLAVAFVAGATLMVAGGIGLVRWQRRLRAVRRSGWWPGHAEISHGTRNRATLTISSGSGPVTVATTEPVTGSIPADLNQSDVYLGGIGDSLTVVLLTGPFVVAAKT